MDENNWYSKWYRERYNRHFDKIKKPAETGIKKEIKLTPEFAREVNKHEKPLNSRYLEYRRREQKLLEDAKHPFHPPKKIPVHEPQKIEAIKYETSSRPGLNIAEPTYLKISNIIILLVPLIILSYLVYLNFFASQEFNYFYDIGSEKDNYLSPEQRISGKIQENISYRNLTGSLVYFNVPVPRGSETIKIQARFKDNFPVDSLMRLGGKDQEVWHYDYNTLYNPSLNNLSEFKNKDNVYLINPNLYLVNYEDLKYEREVVVALDKTYMPIPNIIPDYEKKETIINNSLRGGHVFYVYASGDLSAEIKKQDINWYEDADNLEISLYDMDNNLISNLTIPDDEIATLNKNLAMIQTGVLEAYSLQEGVYKLEFSSFDGLIREIKINTNKIVSDKLFLADNPIYNTDAKFSKIYTNLNRDTQIKFTTYHPAGIQNITYIQDSKSNKTFLFDKEDITLYLNLTKGKYEFIIPKNDILVSYPGYFAFSKENYFEPFRQRVISIPRDINWIKENVDYLVTGYKQPVRDRDWLIAETEFNINENKLFVKDNKLSFVYSTPHLGVDDYLNYTIPIDWINITVQKSGMFGRWGR